ncbi:hypothetical protein HDU98_000603 [Podochytrium sp. JEL0797]|nr:hypothetical protein HDU98_000603 [Podochytrium sp. JEL0797]
MMYGLFSNLNELLDFQRRFMVGMESTLNLGLVEQRIGQLFILNEEAFEVYFPFCGNYQVAQNAALAQAEDLKHLGHIIQPHQIQSYLIKPLQRLMKYPLLLRELIKLTDPETYPYMEELKEGLESIKRVTDKLNEVQRRDENDRTKLDLAERMEDWKGLQIRDFGDLLLVERFLIASNDQEREYYLFLFEKILLCCKKDLKPSSKRTSNRKRSDAGKEGTTYSYILRGNIYINSIVRVEDSSDPSIGSFSIRVYWKEASEPDTVCFSLKCRTEEQVSLWTGRLEKQVELYRRRKNSAGNPTSPYQPIMGNRGSDGYSGYSGNTMFDPGYAASLNSAGSGIYPVAAAQPAPMMRTLSNPSNQYNNLYNYGQMMSPISPSVQYQQFQGQYEQPLYFMQNGVMVQMPQRPPSGQGVHRTSQDRGVARGGQQQFGYAPPMPMSPTLFDAQRMRGGGGYAVGVDGRPVPPSRMESMTSGQIAPRQASMKRSEGPGSAASSAGGVSKSREALNALASLASSGLPIAGFSDDEEESESGGEEEVYSTRGVVADLPRQMQGMQISGRKQSVANGMMMGVDPVSRRISNERGESGPTGMRKVFSDGQQYPVPQNPRYSPQPPVQQQQQQFQPPQRKSNMATSTSFAERRGSPVPPPVSLAQNFQFPQQQQQHSPVVGSPGTSGLQQHLQSRQFAGRPSVDVNAGGPQVMRRAPTAPAYLSPTNSTGSSGMQQQQPQLPQQSSSFIKIRAHYDGDVLIIAMPVRGATLQELRNRVERKVNMMPHKPMLSNPIQMIVKEEVQVGGGAKEWRVVGVLESDEGVGRAFATNTGLLNLFLG